jgi:ABC-type lipopolysaccharide export system ATPase subunit
VVQIIEQTADSLSGPEKKELALSLLNNFYDRVFVVVDVPFVPQLIEPIIHKYIKNILMIMVSASIDATVTIFRNTGVFLRKGNVT